MKPLFLYYPNCSTSLKAKKWLEDNGIDYLPRDIKKENPSVEELKTWHILSTKDIKKFFNTSGMLYRDMELKDKLASMTDSEKLNLLATDGMLVKRPIVIGEDFVLLGFKEKEWADIFLKS